MVKEEHSYPRISIVTPNFNKGDYLEATIQSVLSQNYPNLEYIIMDGGSTDNSMDIIHKYESRLSYWVSEKDKGMYDAIHRGFEHSTGEIMGWINSDDMLHPGALFILADIFSNYPQVNWLTGANSRYDEHGKTVNVDRGKHFSRTDFLIGDYKYIQQESTYWRRSLYDRAGGLDTTLRLAGDLSLWLRFMRTDKLYVVNALIGGFRMCREGQLSGNESSYLEEANKVIASEPLDNEAKQKIKKRRDKIRWSMMLRKFKIFNTGLFDNWLFSEERREANLCTFRFDRSKQSFFLPEA